MNLTIDISSLQDQVDLKLSSGRGTITHSFAPGRNLSERLTPEIRKFFLKNKIRSSMIQTIKLVSQPEHFSRQRTVVATINALVFGLGLKQKSIRPVYSRGPNITLSKT